MVLTNTNVPLRTKGITKDMRVHLHSLPISLMDFTTKLLVTYMELIIRPNNIFKGPKAVFATNVEICFSHQQQSFALSLDVVPSSNLATLSLKSNKWMIGFIPMKNLCGEQQKRTQRFVM